MARARTAAFDSAYAATLLRFIQGVISEATFFLCQGIGKTMPSAGLLVNLSSSSANLATTVEAAIH